MKRIVIDARESGTTTGRYVDKTLEYMHQLPGVKKYEIIVLSKQKRLDFFRKTMPNFQVVATPYKEFTFGEQIGFCKQISKLKADLVFFPLVQQPVLYRGRVVTEMLDLTTIRFRNPAKHWFVFVTKQQVYKLVNKYVAKKSVLLMALTEFVKQDVADYCHVDPAKITVVYNAADKITDAPKPVAALKGKRFILSVGRPAANKNLYRLVDSFNTLAANNPDLHLVLAGRFDSEFERLQSYAQKQPHSDRIIFTDFVTDAQLRWLYERAQVYVFPSLSEGFGLPGLEAMQYDLPVASSNATCLPEVYKDAALYFDPRNTHDMAAKVQQILDDPKVAKQLTKNGQKVVKLYSWKRSAEKTLAVFEKAIG